MKIIITETITQKTERTLEIKPSKKKKSPAPKTTAPSNSPKTKITITQN